MNIQSRKFLLPKNTLEVCQAFLICAVILMLILEPATAQEWATKTKKSIDDFIAGLRILGAAIATLVIIWSAYQIIWGGKRLQDLVPFAVGCALFVGGTELVDAIFGS